jgi:FdhD protein
LPPQTPGTVRSEWYEYRRSWRKTTAEVIEEALITLYVNGSELVTIMATPRDQVDMALGFLKNEGFIDGIDEVDLITVSKNGCCVDVWLHHAVLRPRRIVITSGCGGGVTFNDPSAGIPPLDDEMRISPQELFPLLQELNSADSLYARARGVHASGLAERGRVLALAEDVGRHNTVDKLVGLCLRRSIDPRGKILITTGRVSSEMLRKAAWMKCPIVASRNSPTSMSVAMAEAWNITLVGYVRQGSMRVYSHPERLGYSDSTDSPGGDGDGARRTG